MASMTGGDAPVIRIVKKKGGGAAHHGGAWKVAYADVVTAMMAFFLVMWIVGLSKPTRQAIAAYFKNPSLFEHNGGPKILLADPPAHAKASPLASSEKDKIVEAQLKAKLEEKQQAILRELKETPEFKDLQDSIQVHMTDEGLRIELMEKTSSLFFASGSAKLNPRTIRLLQLIALQLKDLKNPIIVEGHTDSRPLNAANGYSNWELSADRANAARRAMEEHGLHHGQVLAVRGFADRKLLRPQEPTHYSNRRVSILVAYTSLGQ